MIRRAIPIALILCTPASGQRSDYPIQPAAFTSVKVDDGFWAPRIETCREDKARAIREAKLPVEGLTFNVPSAAHGRLVLRNKLELACYELWSE